MARPWTVLFVATLLGVSLGACGVVAGLDDLGASTRDGADATVDARLADGQAAPGADAAPGDTGSAKAADAADGGSADGGSAETCAEAGAACPASACCAPLVCHEDGGCGACKATSGAKCYAPTDCCPDLAPPLFCQRDRTCTATPCIATGSAGCSTSQDNCCVGSFCAAFGGANVCLKCIALSNICGSDSECCTGSCKNNRCAPPG